MFGFDDLPNELYLIVFCYLTKDDFIEIFFENLFTNEINSKTNRTISTNRCVYSKFNDRKLSNRKRIHLWEDFVEEFISNSIYWFSSRVVRERYRENSTRNHRFCFDMFLSKSTKIWFSIEINSKISIRISIKRLRDEVRRLNEQKIRLFVLFV